MDRVTAIDRARVQIFKRFPRGGLSVTVTADPDHPDTAQTISFVFEHPVPVENAHLLSKRIARALQQQLVLAFRPTSTQKMIHSLARSK